MSNGDRPCLSVRALPNTLASALVQVVGIYAYVFGQ